MSLCHQHAHGVEPEFQSKCVGGCLYTKVVCVGPKRRKHEMCPRCGGVKFFNGESCETCRAKAEKDPTLRQATRFPTLLERRAILKVFVDWAAVQKRRHQYKTWNDLNRLGRAALHQGT